jgi:aminoglycoside 3-N-acetyltransferase
MRQRSIDTNQITIKQLQTELQSLGIRAGDALMVHASVRSVGPVEERGQGVLSALLDVLGPEGSLMAYTDFEPTLEVPYFDMKRSPARPDYGVLAELVRTYPGAVRSANPGASMVAIGAKAQWLCEEHSLDYGYGPGGPLGKLVSARGKVLLLGSDLDQVTLLHLAEHLADIPDKRVVKRPLNVMHDDGSIESVMIEEFDTSNPVASSMPEKVFAAIVGSFLATGAASSGRVGRALSYLMPATELVSYAVSVIERDYGRRL